MSAHNPGWWDTIAENIPDPVARMIRTFVQSFCGTLITLAGGDALDINKIISDMDWVKKIVFSAVVSGIIAVVTLGNNLYEDKTKLPTPTRALKHNFDNEKNPPKPKRKRKPKSKDPLHPDVAEARRRLDERERREGDDYNI